MYKFQLIPYTLRFVFDARTSRGSMTGKDTLFLKITDTRTNITGWGECCTIKNLSLDGDVDYFSVFSTMENQLKDLSFKNQEELFRQIAGIVPEKYAALRMGLETAFSDILQGGVRKIFEGDFHGGKSRISINGLVWMGDYNFMKQQVKAKIEQGFSCIKIKVGSLAFEEECRLLEYIRTMPSGEEITLRLDANGAFEPEKALQKLQKLSAFDIHSIEQPIKAGQHMAMHELTESSPIPIALDEELIGVTGKDAKDQLLKTIRPDYLVLKPSLHGGFGSVSEWIALAEKQGIGWWVTSALESDIGLNAIAQYTDQFNPVLPQGLGTGKLYSNNIASPLRQVGEYLEYQAKECWKFEGMR